MKYKTVLDSAFRIVDARIRFKYWIPRFVSDTWILDSSRCRVGFRIP